MAEQVEVVEEAPEQDTTLQEEPVEEAPKKKAKKKAVKKQDVLSLCPNCGHDHFSLIGTTGQFTNGKFKPGSYRYKCANCRRAVAVEDMVNG